MADAVLGGTGGHSPVSGPRRGEFVFSCTDGALFLDKPAATREKMTDGCAYIYIYICTYVHL